MIRKQAVNIYDFDHTIYDGDVSMHFILYCQRRNPRLWKYLPVSAFALIGYMIGLYDRKQVKEAAFSFLQSIKDIDTTVDLFWQGRETKIKRWYIELHKDTDIIISASPEFLLRPITKTLGVKKLIATKMDKNTGKIAGKNCRAEEKVERLHAYDHSLVINACYSDSMSDKPLFDIAQQAYIVKKHKIVPFGR